MKTLVKIHLINNLDYYVSISRADANIIIEKIHEGKFLVTCNKDADIEENLVKIYVSDDLEPSFIEDYLIISPHISIVMSKEKDRFSFQNFTMLDSIWHIKSSNYFYCYFLYVKNSFDLHNTWQINLDIV